jgi:hypothetical protein
MKVIGRAFIGAIERPPELIAKARLVGPRLDCVTRRLEQPCLDCVVEEGPFKVLRQLIAADLIELGELPV